MLKDYFDETFEIKASEVTSISDLRNKLQFINPSAADVLNSCRFAVNEEFVQGNYQLKEEEHVYILPPSSGG